jgi:phosphotransferase system HPr-like phosphotransfer protein
MFLSLKEVAHMKKVMVKLDSITSVKDFVSIVMLYDFDIDLVSGRYAVDAKSIMGIFSLDLSNPIQLVARTEDPGDFFDKIKDFIVE